MEDHKSLLNTYYSALARRDFSTVCQCYHPDVIYNDTIFQDLRYKEVCAMWEMLLRSGKDLKVSYGGIEVDGDRGMAGWEAHYTYTQTGRLVHNTVQSKFVFKDCKIVEQTDIFSFYSWAKQAFGPMGLFMGSTRLFRSLVCKKAYEKLQRYIQKNAS